MSSNIPIAPQGAMPAIGLPDSQDYPRLVFAAPYFEQVPLAELIEPSVIEAVEAALPSLVPPYVDASAQAAVQQLAVLLTGSTMSGPLFLSPLMPSQPSQAATMAYVDSMVATAGIPEVPPVPVGQVWARETGQWTPITPQTGVFLPLSGGAMVGNINMSGNTIQNMAAVPAMPNGAAPAQWVLNQIASVSLFQGQWDADTNVPDLTQLSVRVNGYTWIAITTSVSGVVVGQAIPGLQGKTIFNGDTIYYSTVDGAFFSIHAGGLTLPEAQSLFVLLAGSQMSGPLLLNANASQPLQAVTLQQLQAFVPPGAVGEAPNDGQLYGRNGLTASWSPVLPLAGGILTGSLTLAGNATQALQPATYGQMNSAITAAVAAYLPLAGAAMTGLMTLSGNASVGLNPVPLQQLTAMLATYVTTTQLNTALAAYVPLAGGVTLTGNLTLPSLTATTGLSVTGPGNALSVTNQAVIGGQLSSNTLVVDTNATVSGIATINDCTVSGTGVALTLPNGAASIAGQLTVGGTVTVPAAGITYTGHGSVGFQVAGANELTASLNGGAAQWVVVGTFPGYQACTNLAMAPDFSYGLLAQNASVYSFTIAPSDRRLKSHIRDADRDALGIINEIAVHDLDCQMHPDVEPEHWDFSLITDEVKPHLPYAVITPPDMDGTAVYESFHTQHLIAVLWRAVQQLSGRVGALEAR